MSGTSKKTKSISIRVDNQLLQWLEHKAVQLGKKRSPGITTMLRKLQEMESSGQIIIVE
jgi:metal-responsive CopG/Arc/MetJ family transcriptional regulator